MVVVVLGENMRLEDATTAASQSPASIAWQASYTADIEDEQAVRIVILDKC